MVGIFKMVFEGLGKTGLNSNNDIYKTNINQIKLGNCAETFNCIYFLYYLDS